MFVILDGLLPKERKWTQKPYWRGLWKALGPLKFPNWSFVAHWPLPQTQKFPWQAWHLSSVTKHAGLKPQKQFPASLNSLSLLAEKRYQVIAGWHDFCLCVSKRGSLCLYFFIMEASQGMYFIPEIFHQPVQCLGLAMWCCLLGTTRDIRGSVKRDHTVPGIQTGASYILYVFLPGPYRDLIHQESIMADFIL